MRIAMVRTPLRLVVVVGVAVLGACSNTSSPGDPGQTLEAYSGNNQTAPPRTALPQPIVVRAAGATGSLAGIPIQFSVLTGDGFLSLSNPVRIITVTTDASGLAQAPWRLGPISGANAQSVIATIVGGSGSITFFANAIPGPPVGVFFLVQPSTVGGNAPFNPTVQVAIGDANANIVTTAPPTVVTIQSGRASVTGGGTATTQAGVAAFPDLRVCPTAGSAGNTIIATAPGYSGVTSASFTVGLGC